MLSEGEWQAVRLTFLVSTCAVGISFPFAVGLAWLMAKKSFPGKWFVEVLVNLPLVLPPVVTGYFIIILFGKSGWLGSWLAETLGVRLVFDWKGAVLAATVVGFPLFVRPIRLAFEQMDHRLIQAARTLGASRWDAFFSIALPIARPGILAGGALAFARSMGEFGATIMIAGNIPGETQTISLMIYSLLESPNGINQSLSLVSTSIVVAAVALVLCEWVEHRQNKRRHEGLPHGKAE
jgi:molybdate transport system permease protein